MKVILNTKLVTLNEYINAERSHRIKAAKIKKQQTNAVAYLCLEQGFEVPNGLYDLRFIWYKPNNKIDHDNIAFTKKFVLDGFKLARVINDDSPKYIRNFTDTFIIDKTRNYISCAVEFIKVEKL